MDVLYFVDKFSIEKFYKQIPHVFHTWFLAYIDAQPAHVFYKNRMECAQLYPNNFNFPGTHTHARTNIYKILHYGKN